MMATKRKRHSGEFKAKVALEALKGLKTMNELAAGYGVHPTQISQWKRQLGAEAKEIFGSRRLKEAQDQEVVQASLYEEIGRLKMELDWVQNCGPRLRRSGRSQTSGVEHPAPACAAGAAPLEPLLRAGAGEPGRSGADAVHRRAVHAHAVLRLAADEGGAGRAGVSGEPQAGAAADAPNGALGDRAWAAHEPRPSRAQGPTHPDGAPKETPRASSRPRRDGAGALQ
jgi:transposase